MSTVHLQRTQPSALTKLSQLANKLLAKPLTNMDSFGAYLEPIIQLAAPNWRYNTIQASVLSVTPENKNVYTLTLKPNTKWQSFKAGQFVQLTVEKDGSYYTRTFSISSSPRYFEQTGQIQLSIRTQTHGIITPWLAKTLRSGHVVYISQASGEFTIKPTLNKKLFIAAGSGITPIKSMLSEHTQTIWFKNASLIFYVRNHAELLFQDELKKYASAGLNVKVIYTEELGRISDTHLQEYAAFTPDQESYICGPAEMIDASVSVLRSLNMPNENINFEYFGPAPIASLPNDNFDKDDENEVDEFIQVDYLSSNKQVQFNAENIPKTLLDMAEQEGLKPTSGCRIGVCHQCICKKKQGRVFNTKTKQYSDTGEEEIQLCLSVPVGHVELEL